MKHNPVDFDHNTQMNDEEWERAEEGHRKMREAYGRWVDEIAQELISKIESFAEVSLKGYDENTQNEMIQAALLEVYGSFADELSKEETIPFRKE
jgi:hypothetical protein